MSTISFRRYPDKIIRRRSGRGSYVLGVFEPGEQVWLEIAAAVQPLAREDRDFEGGAQQKARLKCYVPQSGDPDASPLTPILAAAFERSEADRVVWQGRLYVVEESRAWPRFTRAILLRET